MRVSAPIHAGSRWGSTAIGSPCCWRWRIATPDCSLQGQDVFANVVGGVRLAETAGDLAIVMAARSSLRDSPVPPSLIAFGELGLAGEIRPVPFGEERLREAAKHGFKSAVVPEANVPKRAPDGMSVLGVTRLNQALEAF